MSAQAISELNMRNTHSFFPDQIAQYPTVRYYKTILCKLTQIKQPDQRLTGEPQKSASAH